MRPTAAPPALAAAALASRVALAGGGHAVPDALAGTAADGEETRP